MNTYLLIRSSLETPVLALLKALQILKYRYITTIRHLFTSLTSILSITKPTIMDSDWNVSTYRDNSKYFNAYPPNAQTFLKPISKDGQHGENLCKVPVLNPSGYQ